MQENRCIILFIILCLSMLCVVQAQTNAPLHPINGEYIKEWLVLGPFFPSALHVDLLANDGGEAKIDPKEGDIIVTAQGDTLTWRRHQASGNINDLLKIIGNYQNATAYAFCTLNSINTGRGKILLGSDDGAAVWINSQRVHYNNAARPLFIDHDMFEVDLKEGVNRCLVKISQSTGAWSFVVRAFPQDQTISAIPKFFLSPEYVNNMIWLIYDGWKYHSGDNAEWAIPEFDDSSWESVGTELRPDELPLSGWQKTGWFRLHIDIDSALVNQPIGLFFWQAGSSQLYLDGKLIYSFDENKNDWNGVPKAITFTSMKNHVIAVRYTNLSVTKYHRAGMNAGFSIRLGKLDQMTEESFNRGRTFTGFQMFFTSLALAIGLLHLILFTFFPRLRQNLIFALFLFSYAATIFYDYQILLSADLEQYLFSFRMHCASLPLWVIFQLWFVYSLFEMKLPIQFWIISLVAFCLGGMAVYKPEQNFDYFGIVYMATYIEVIRIIIVAFYRRIEGTWIIGMGFLVFFIFGLLDALMDEGIIMSLREIENPYAFGSIGFFIAMSIYLSRDFSRTNKKIAEQEIEKKLLKAENARQSKELEEARDLQISMLPKDLPQIPHIEIGVFMKTATEVGGDYYDFKLHDDGTLTIVIGDATGHGMQAGTMVSATKSLFLTLADERSPSQFLKKGTETIKAMGLKKMYMALLLAKFNNQTVNIAAAGMPYPIIYRSSTNQIEEVILKGMPLGSFTNFLYEEKKINLNKGDTILFMSDGFEEMFNPQDEILGEMRVKEHFQKIAINSPEEIIDYLKKSGEDWANGRDQEDDVTFVVIKIK